MSLFNKSPGEMSTAELAEALEEIQPHIEAAIAIPEAAGFDRDAMNLYRIARTIGRSAARGAMAGKEQSEN